MTYTVTNAMNVDLGELTEKDGWDFTDSLPEDLIVLSPVSGTCKATTTVEGDSHIIVSDGCLSVGEESCMITVLVTSDSAASYISGLNGMTTTGLNLSGDATVTFSGPRISRVRPSTVDLPVGEPSVGDREPGVDDIVVPGKYWKDNTMRLLKTTDGRMWLVRPGAPVHILNASDLRLLQKALNSDPASPEKFTTELKGTIDWYVRQLTKPSNRVDSMFIRVKGGVVYVAGSGGIVQILNRADLDLLQRYLEPETDKFLAFTLRQKDIFNGYLKRQG